MCVCRSPRTCETAGDSTSIWRLSPGGRRCEPATPTRPSAFSAWPSSRQPLSCRAPATAVRDLDAKQIAWFYCFAAPNGEKALEWANSGYAAEPNSPEAAALLAYALSLNDGQLEWVKPLLASFQHNQIADLVQAQIQLAGNDKAGAIETLKMAVSKDPASFAAERAKEMLAEQGGSYTPPVNAEAVMNYLAKSLGQQLIPRFVKPEQMLELQLNIKGNEFTYGREIEATVAIGNKGLEPLAITENGLFTGHIRVDAPGDRLDLNPRDPKRGRSDDSHRVGGSARAEPGRPHQVVGWASATRAVGSSAGVVEYDLYALHRSRDGGQWRGTQFLVGVPPVTVSIARPGVELTTAYLRNRHEAITSHRQDGQIARTAQLFTGLLKEQQIMAAKGTLYSYMSAQWLNELLRSSLIDKPVCSLTEGDGQWDVPVDTMANMLSLSLDEELATVVAKNLKHPKWPVRLMTVYLLAHQQFRQQLLRRA